MLRLGSWSALAPRQPAWGSPAIRSLATYALTAVACLAALALGLAAAPLDAGDDCAALMFLAVVGLSGWYGGLGPALLATALGAVAMDYFFESPRHMLEVSDARTVVDLLAFLLVAALLGSLNARLRYSNTQLRAERNRAEAALDARDELLAAVSHEFRTPLTAIKASVYTLRDQGLQMLPTTRHKLLANIEADTDRLTHFVNGVLAFRRLQNGYSPHWEWSAPGEVASAVLDRCLPRLGSRPVKFCIPDDLPPVRVDAALLDQVLSVLLANVAVHTPPSAPVAIEGAICGRDLRLAVSDGGPGIPVEAREKIFDKYMRLGHTSSGIGLGLSIARAAAKAQGGRLCVEDSSLGGASFVLVIPNAVGDQTLE